jgi:hypothetical protein
MYSYINCNATFMPNYSVILIPDYHRWQRVCTYSYVGVAVAMEKKQQRFNLDAATEFCQEVIDNVLI